MRRALSFLVGIVVALSLCSAAFAQEYREHVVARGETASAIAKKYNITEAVLFETNPALKNYCYAGMKLRIPAASAKTTVAEIVGVAENEGVTKGEKPTNTSESSERYYLDGSGDGGTATAVSTDSGIIAPFNVFAWQMGRFGFVSSDAYSLSFTTIGVNHFFDKSLYLGAQLLGYSGSHSYASYGDYNISTDNHYIVLPVELGYHLWLSKSRFDNYYKEGNESLGYSIAPYLGAEISYLVKATTKIGDQKESVKPDKRFGILAKVGAKLMLNGYYFDAGYLFNNDGGFFFVGFGCFFPL